MPFQLGNRLRSRPLAERYWEKVDKRGPVECWPWKGSTYEGGYGAIRYGDGTTRGAHRVGWELANGKPPPEDREVCHSCDNPPCQNPAHFFLGTHQANMADMSGKGRAGDRTWVKGRPRPAVAGERNPMRRHPELHVHGEQHPDAKLNESQVRDIRARRAAGASGYSLAKAFGVSEQAIAAIVKRKTWKHVA
jgi:hypothetical protein